MPSHFEHKGCRFAYEKSGSGDPVLLIQGVGVHGAGWRPQVDRLSPEFTCVTFDNRGMGQSQPAGAPITVEQMAEDALVLMDTLGWQSAHIVGHSLGGLIAQQMALSQRERVRSLALLCTFHRGWDGMGLTPWMMWTGLRSKIGPKPSRRRAFLKIVLAPGEWADRNEIEVAAELAQLFGHDLAEQPPVVNAQLRAMSRYDARPRLAELSGIPTLVASATHDPIARPQSGRRLAASIPGAVYHEFPNASHGVPITQPNALHTLLYQHLALA